MERSQKYLTDVGLVEASPNHVEFEAWANRMGCTDETKKELLRLLDTTPAAAKEFFHPRIEDDRLMFSIREAILIAPKP